MRKSLIFLILFIGFRCYGQVDVILSVSQLSELGFDISNQETTITSGESVLLGGDLVVFGGAGNYSYSWSPVQYLDDPTILNPVASPTETTTFYLTVEDAYGCSFTLTYTVYVQKDNSVTDLVTDNGSGFEAKLFPNPNNGIFKVRMTGNPCNIISLNIIDIAGKVYQARTVNNFSGEHTEEFDIVLKKGVYLLSVEAGDYNSQRRFIIK